MVTPSRDSLTMQEQNGVVGDSACSFCQNVDEENRNLSLNALHLVGLIDRIEVSLNVRRQLENERDQLQRQLEEKDTYIESLKQEEVNIRCQLSRALSENEPYLRELNSVRKEKEELFKAKEDFAIKFASSEATLRQIYDLMKTKEDELASVKKQKEEVVRLKDELATRAITAETNLINARATLQEAREESISLNARFNALLKEFSAGQRVITKEIIRRERASSLNDGDVEQVVEQASQEHAPPVVKPKLISENRFTSPPKRRSSKRAPLNMTDLIPLGSKRPRNEIAPNPTVATTEIVAEPLSATTIASGDATASFLPISNQLPIPVKSKKPKKTKRPKIFVLDVTNFFKGFLTPPLSPIREIEFQLQAEQLPDIATVNNVSFSDDDDIGLGGLKIVEEKVASSSSDIVADNVVSPTCYHSDNVFAIDATDAPSPLRLGVAEEVAVETTVSEEAKKVDVVEASVDVVQSECSQLKSTTVVDQLSESVDQPPDSLSPSRQARQDFENEFRRIKLFVAMNTGFSVSSSGQLIVSEEITGMIGKLMKLSFFCKRKFVQGKFLQKLLSDMKVLMAVDDESLKSENVIQNLVVNLYIATKLFSSKSQSAVVKVLAGLVSDIIKCQRVFVDDPTVRYVVRFAMLRFGLFRDAVLKRPITDEFTRVKISKLSRAMQNMYKRYTKYAKK